MLQLCVTTHYLVVVDLETLVCLPKTGKRKETKFLFPETPKPRVQRGFSKGPGGNSGWNSVQTC